MSRSMVRTLTSYRPANCRADLGRGDTARNSSTIAYSRSVRFTPRPYPRPPTFPPSRGSAGGLAGSQCHDQVGLEGGSEALQDRQCRYGSAGLDPRDRRLSHASGPGELALAPAASLAKRTDGPAEFVGAPRRLVRLGRPRLRQPPLPQIRPILPLTHVTTPSRSFRLVLNDRMRLDAATPASPSRLAGPHACGSSGTPSAI